MDIRFPRPPPHPDGLLVVLGDENIGPPRMMIVTTEDEVEISDQIPGFSQTIGKDWITAAFLGKDDRYWIATCEGEPTRGRVGSVWVGTLDEGFTRVAARTSSIAGRCQYFFAQDPEAPPGEVYTLTDFHDLERYGKGGQNDWEILEDGGSAYISYSGNLAWSDGAAYSQRPIAQRRFRRWSPARGAQQLDVNDAEGARTGPGASYAMAPTPLGLLVFNADMTGTNIYRMTDRFEPIALNVQTQQTEAAAGFVDGFVITGFFGFVTQFTKGDFCESHGGLIAARRSSTSFARRQRLAQLGPRALFSSGLTSEGGDMLPYASVIYSIGPRASGQ